MKIKTMLKFLLCFFIIASLLSLTVSLAEENNVSKSFFEKGEDGFKNVKVYLNGNNDNVVTPLKDIQRLVLLIGTFLGVIVSLIYGIQWVTATSAKRQELKAGLYPLVIGVTLLVVGPRLTIWIYELLSKSEGKSFTESVKVLGGTSIILIQSIGYAIAVIMLLVVGIQWIMANPGKRQELKSRLVNIIIGAILIVAGSTILGLVAKVADDSKDSIVTVKVENSETYIV